MRMPLLLATGIVALVSGAHPQSIAAPPAARTVVLVRATTTAPLADVPSPPRVISPAVSERPFAPVPGGGPGLPQPRSPMTVPARGGDAGIAAPCDLRFFLDGAVQPTGALPAASNAAPNVTAHGDVVLHTANHQAALSRDSGSSWTHVDPFTRFPASDGGFCCDQRVLHVPSVGLTVWMLEYAYSATTRTGRMRVALARNRFNLRDGVFHFFDLTPADFGASNRYLASGDLAYSNGNLYGSAVLATPAGAAAGLVVWRADLLTVWGLGRIELQYYTSSVIGGVGAYRFAQGATNPMYFAAHASTSRLRVFSWDDGSPFAAIHERSVAPWSSTPTPAPGPDGRDWTGFPFTLNSVMTGYARAGEVGFLWTSGAVAGRPQTFVRVARLRASDLIVVGQDDVWHAEYAFHLPACAVNARGDVGGTIAWGGGGAAGAYPSAAAFLVDACAPQWAPLDHTTFAPGARGPDSNRFGDWFGAARHPVVTATFLGAGYALDAAGNAVPRCVWFGRERDEPGWVDVALTARDAFGSALALPLVFVPLDRLGAGDGTTPLQRSYAPSQRLVVTAPSEWQDAAGTRHRFRRWSWQGTPQLAGLAVLDVDVGSGPGAATAEATYDAIRTVTIDAQPSAAVAIAVDPTDLLGRGDGTTPLVREYFAGTQVTLEAPPRAGDRLFRWWLVDGVAQTPLQTRLLLDVAADAHARADYGAIAGAGPDWSDVGALSPTAPSPRHGARVVFDSVRGACVLFGGSAGGDETWELRGDTWTRVVSATTPSARDGHALAWDPALARTLLFGGSSGGSETWSWDGVDWALLQPANAPTARRDAAFAWHAGSGRALLFGGRDATGDLADTWAFDGSDWTLLLPPTSPPPLDAPAMAYDSLRDRVVLVGSAPTAASLDTWEWTGSDWTRATPATAPGSRAVTALAFDALRGRAVLFSGARDGGTAVPDTWEWDGVDWQQRFTTTLPPARGAHALVHDAWRNRVVMFGGILPAGAPRGDTWEYGYECEPVGPGHPGGGLPLTCTSPPRLGGNLCLSFPSGAATGWLAIGLTPPLRPPNALHPPIACRSGDLWPSLDIVLPADGDPGTACIAVPADVGLIGAFVVAQGIALQAVPCFELSDAVVVVVRR